MKLARSIYSILGLLSAMAVFPARAAAQDFSPYPAKKTTLDNGLDILIVEMPEFKDVLSFNMLVLVGARNEPEAGKTGFAHLFEHIMFRHKFNGEPDGYALAIDRLGAHNNAWTWFDVTFYHPLTFTANLEAVTRPSGEVIPGLLELEAARFTALDFNEEIFKTETGAVMGEYRKSATSPRLAMSEKQLALAYPDHPYGHTTMGFYDDVIDMPNHYEHARWFHSTYYRPNNCVLVVAGDITQEDLLPDLEAAFGGWEPGDIPAVPGLDPNLNGEKRGEVPWEAPVPPRVSVSYLSPRFVVGSKATAVGQVLGELLTSESAPLYRLLRSEKKTASSLHLSATEGFGPRLVELDAQLFNDQYADRGKELVEEVIDDVIAGCEDLKHFSQLEGAGQLLEMVKSKYKYDLLAQLNSPANVALSLAYYYRFERDPQVLDRLVRSVQELTPEDIDAFARDYFVADNRVVVTLAPVQQ